MRIYNSLTKQKEEFRPLDPAGKEVRMYVCGPTVYDEPHIGHLRSAFIFDFMRRYLEYVGYRVKFVRNVTDVDDKIIVKAQESSPTDFLAEVQAVSDKYFKLYKEDLKVLGIQEPSVEPKATTHIQEMHWLIQKLIESGKAYAVEGDVYFHVNGFKDYGKLSHQNKEAILQNVRIEKNEKKRDVLDFALWKKVKDGEPSWPSPWGPGRPGWHIECSAMSMKYLGETFDIHGGGRDLIFPHHENEVAQSESVTGSPFAKTWIHHGLITVNEQKMSKSLKNYITLKEIASGGASRIEELKFLFLGTHYSAPLDYSEAKMKMEKSIREKFIEFLMKGDEGQNTKTTSPEEIEAYRTKFLAAMSDDFNTPLALTVMHELVNHVNKNPQDIALAGEAKKAIKEFFDILGLSYSETQTHSLSDEAMALIRQRDEAKHTKNYAKADELRKVLLDQFKLKVIDEKDGKTRWVSV